MLVTLLIGNVFDVRGIDCTLWKLDSVMLIGQVSRGWRSVQLRVLHELVYSARRMGNAAIAIRLNTLTVFCV